MMITKIGGIVIIPIHDDNSDTMILLVANRHTWPTLFYLFRSIHQELNIFYIVDKKALLLSHLKALNMFPSFLFFFNIELSSKHVSTKVEKAKNICHIFFRFLSITRIKYQYQIVKTEPPLLSCASDHQNHFIHLDINKALIIPKMKKLSLCRGLQQI